MVEFGTSSAFRGWVRVRVLGYGFGVRGRKVKSRDCALASDLVRAYKILSHLPSAKRAEGRAARGRPGNVWQLAPQNPILTRGLKRNFLIIQLVVRSFAPITSKMLCATGHAARAW